MFQKVFQKFFYNISEFIFNEAAEFGIMKFQYPKVLWRINVNRFVFGIVLFYRGKFIKVWVNDLFVPLIFCAKVLVWCGNKK